MADPEHCKECGAELPDESASCPACGADVMDNYLRHIKELVEEKNRNLTAEKKSDVSDPTKGWNFGAFMLPTLWCFWHDQWGYGFLFLSRFILYSISLVSFELKEFYSVFILYVIIDAIFASRANKLAWTSRTYKTKSSFFDKQNNFYFFGCIKLILLLVFSFFAYQILYPPHNKSDFEDCISQLSNTKTGIGKYLKENDTLLETSIPDDICNLILPGFDNASDCLGVARDRIDGKDGVCRKNTYSFKTLDGYKYELRAISKDKRKCKICVTEITATPDRYDKCARDMKFECAH